MFDARHHLYKSTTPAIFQQILHSRLRDHAEDIDSALSTAICETDTAQGNANDLASVTKSAAASNFAPGEYVAFKVFRDADSSEGGGTDNMTGDARLVKVKIEYSVSQESD